MGGRVGSATCDLVEDRPRVAAAAPDVGLTFPSTGLPSAVCEVRREASHIPIMGISLSWVAVEALPADEALLRLSLARTAKDVAYPFKGVASHALPNDWFLVAAGRCDHRIAHAASMSVLSKGCRAVACAVEEHVNFASAELWQDGARVWHVQHRGDEDSENMSAEGRLPPRFQELLATVESEGSENLDGHFHMDIPLMLAKELCGFRHDEANAEFDNTPFEELGEIKIQGSWRKPWK